VTRNGWRERLEDTRVLAIALCVTWGLMFIVQRVALEVAGPIWVAAGRCSVGAVVLLAFAGTLRDLGRRGLVIALVLGLTNQFGFLGLQVAGLRTVDAGPAAAIIYLQPVLVVLASSPFLGERLTPRRLAGALLGFAGVAVVGLHQSAAASASGVLLLIAAAVSWAAGAIVTSASGEPIVPLVVGQHPRCSWRPPRSPSRSRRSPRSSSSASCSRGCSARPARGWSGARSCAAARPAS
jgi:drug/metabolite transporter (DMT)-like permease